MIDVSVVIVNYKVKEYIISSIHSIYEHTKPNIQLEVIVVDNNSNDGSSELLKEKFPNATIICNSYNAGFSKAVNQGVKKCNGNYIFILNPDTLFTHDCLNVLIEVLKKYKNFGAVGPKLISEKGSLQQSFWETPTILNTLKSVIYLNPSESNKNINETFEVKSLSGAAILIPRNIFNELGGLNEDLFWMEDVDFSYRMRKNGYKIYFCPKAEIVHFSGKSAEKNYNISISNQLMSKIKFFKIHHSKLSFSVVYLIILFISLLKTVIFLFFAPFSKKFRLKFIAYLYTTYSILAKLSLR